MSLYFSLFIALCSFYAPTDYDIFYCRYQSQINKKWNIAIDLEFLSPGLSLCIDGIVVLKLTLMKWQGGVEYMTLAQVRDMSRDRLNMIMNLQISSK
jgi:hypothetical protein